MAMRDRDARRAQPGRPEAEAQYGERLRVQAGGETAKVLAHDLERKPPNPRSGDGRVKPERVGGRHTRSRRPRSACLRNSMKASPCLVTRTNSESSGLSPLGISLISGTEESTPNSM
jgi:hypothetical protein